ncbi:MAG: lytic transglycosylase domain-containing protein [Rhodoferax sp.]
MRFKRIVASIVWLVTLPWVVWADAPALTAQEQAIVEMAAAFKSGQSSRLPALLTQARGHILEPWAAYWALRARLEDASADEVAAFFERYAGTYQEDRLRNDWLLLLGRRGDASGFAAALGAFRMNDDPEVRCYAQLLGQTSVTPEQAQAALALWLRQKGASEACASAVERHVAQGLLAPAVLWHKARQALVLRRSAGARQAVELAAPQALGVLDKLLKKPQATLKTLKAPWTDATAELAVLGLQRWADTDPDAAALALRRIWAPRLSTEQRHWAWAAIGQRAAQRLSDNALSYYAQSRPQGLSDELLGWWARAALRRHQWTEAGQVIAAMRPEMQADPTWQYWRARSLLQPQRSAADQAQGRSMLESIAGLQGFYPMLALEELGRPLQAPPQPAALTDAEKAAARANPGLQRALAAFALGLRSEAVREWNYTTNLHSPGGMNDRELLAAADLACSAKIWDRCINTSERTRTEIDLRQRFPMPHHDAVLARSADIGLEAAYVYGLIRQESRFVMDARSGVGAAGLMQVMPATARWTARKIGLSGFKPHHLDDRDTNIAIGTGYLKLVLDNFGDSLPLAAAAYNAGPGRARLWRSLAGPPDLDPAIWAENIPFDETRDYVKKVLANTTVYALVLGQTAPSLRARLGRIDTSASASDRDLP